jgi:hypothetical protein
MDVRLPNGMIIRGVPKGTTKDQILSKLKAKGYDVDELLKPLDLLEDYEPTKEEGVIAAAKRGAESLISSGRTALESMFGDEEEAAKRGLERGEDIAKRYEEGPSLDRIKRIYEEQGLLSAAGQAVSDIPEAVAAQLPNLASTAASARLGAMAGSAFGPVGTAVGAGLGAVAPSVLQQFGAGVERQAAEGATDIDLAKAGAAGVAGGALETAAQAIPFGKQGLRIILGETGEKLFKAGAADDLENLASEGLAKTLAKGTATGIVAEVPTEIAQQMLERWQAGLDLTTPDALKEYGEVAYQAGLLGPIGGVGRVVERAGARGELDAREEAAQAAELPQSPPAPPVEPGVPVQGELPLEGGMAAARPAPVPKVPPTAPAAATPAAPEPTQLDLPFETPTPPAVPAAPAPAPEPTQLGLPFEPPAEPAPTPPAPAAVAPVPPVETPPEPKTPLFTPPVKQPKIDLLLPKAVEVVQTLNRAGISTLQRNLGIGWARAKKLIGILEQQGIVSAPGADGLRKVIKKPEPAKPEGAKPSEPPTTGRTAEPSTPPDIGAVGAGAGVPVQRGAPVKPSVTGPRGPAVGTPVGPTSPAPARKGTEQPPLDRLPPVGAGPIPQERDEVGDPLPREARIIEQGVRGKNIHEVAKFIMDTAPHPAMRAIARRVGDQLRRMEDSGVSSFNFELVDSGNERASARGSNIFSVNRITGKITNSVRVKSSAFKGTSGASYRTVLHELVHAATTSAINVGKEAPRNSKLYKDAKALSDVFKVIKKEVDKLKEAKATGRPLNKFQTAIVNKYNNAVQNEDEVLTWGLTDRDMQQWLETIPYEGNKSLWTKFVEKIRDVLGLPAGAESALSEILRTADRLLDADVREVQANIDYYINAFSKRTRRRDASVQEIRVEQADLVNEPGTIANNFPRFDEKLGDRVANALSRVAPGLRKGVLGFMTMNQLAEVYGKYIPSISSLEKTMNARAAKLMQRREQMDSNLLKWYKIAQNPKHKKLLPKFFDIANESTRLQVVFDKTDPEYDANHPLTRRFEAMPEPLQKVYFELLNDYKAKSDEFLNLLAQNLTASEMSKLRAAYESKRLKVYLPLFRQGEYWVTYQDKNNETVTIAVETENEQKKLAQWARNNTIDPRSIQIYSRMMQPDWRQMPPSGFVGDVVKTLSNQGIDDKTINSIYELFLNYLPSESIRQNFRPRQKVLGFEPDILQVYANMASRMSNQLTNMQYALEIEKTMENIRGEVGEKASKDLLDVQANLQGQVDFMRDPKNANWASQLSYFSYLFYIAGNVSSAAINLTQMPMVVYPLLGGKYGMGRALSAMNAAKNKYFQGGWDDNNEFLRDWTFGKGKNISPEYKDLYDRAVNQGAIRRSTGYEIAEARKVRTEDFVGLRARVEHGLGYFFQNSERMNREITLLAAYDLARKDKKSHEQAIDEAIQLVNDAHGASLAETGPRFFQNDIGKVIFTFKRFAQSQIYLLAKLFNNTFRGEDPQVRAMARKQLIGIAGMSYLFAGVQGMPLYGAGALLASLTQMGEEDEPFDFDAEIRKLIGDLGYKGPVNQLFSVDVASRTGFNGLLWKDDPQRLAEIGPFLYAVERVAGPAYSAFQGIGRGAEQFLKGYYGRGLEAMTPLFIRNGLKSLRLGTEDARTKDGVLIVEDIGKYNVFMQLLGFNPAELAESRARTGAMKTAEKKILARRASLYDKLDMARVNGDFDGVQEVMQEIMEFNQKHPTLKIDGNGIASSYRERRRRERESVEGVSLSPRLRQKLMDEYGGY